MWFVMMVAMMLPSLMPMLWRYRQAVGGEAGAAGCRAGGLTGVVGGVGCMGGNLRIGTRGTRLGWLTALVGGGYYFVWTLFGIAAFPVGIALAAIEMQHPALARAVPIAVGVVVLIAGCMQFTGWKARQLACCREIPGRGRVLPANPVTAWRHGVRLGVYCVKCCASLMGILLVVGVMDLRAMAVVTTAMTLERLAPAGECFARAIGVVVLATGLLLIAGCR
jgi:predicted metal-binding membrane protein